MLTQTQAPVRHETSTLNCDDLIRKLKSHFQAQDETRRGICLLNAGKFDEAALAFSRASVYGEANQSLASLIAACYVGKGEHEKATQTLTDHIDSSEPSIAIYIRAALGAWMAESRDQAIQILREGISVYPESAELHFQLGTLLSDLEEFEEAELRFTQAVNIDRNHTNALVSLAMCHGLRQDPCSAIACLRRAQQQKPHDPQIGLLLSQAAMAVRQTGALASPRADMPALDPTANREDIEELASIIEADPEFVDSFISIPPGEVDETVFAVLLKTLEIALEKQPEQAELHFHTQQVLTRLGRMHEAIGAGERAIGLNPRFTRALIELGKLYQETDRSVDAANRLEQAVKAGAQYADVFYMLGNLYKSRGDITQAKHAYRKALEINNRYSEARLALEALSV